MMPCFFVADLHGRIDRYEKLFDAISTERPAAVFLGGDLLPSGLGAPATHDGAHSDFVSNYLLKRFCEARERLADAYPRVFVILGNDDPRSEEAAIMDGAADGIWEYMHDGSVALGGYRIYGYACVPPTPFPLKDWERYDVSQYVDPGCMSPEEGHRTVHVDMHEVRYATIQADLERLAGNRELGRAIMLLHAPPYRTKLDRAALDGRMVDHVPVDVHVGSIAIQRFIADRQPLLTLHGHVHESVRLTGAWQDQIGRTVCFSAAHDGPELALVRFDLEDLETATRTLI